MSQFKNNSYYILVTFQVLEHHQRPKIFFAEAARILKKSGILIISFPFIWELHEGPNDFQRLTHYKIQELCNDNNLKIVEQIKRGGLLSAISQLVNFSLANANMPKFIKVVLYLLFLLPFQYFAYIYENIFSKPERKIFLRYTFLLQKE